MPMLNLTLTERIMVGLMFAALFAWFAMHWSLAFILLGVIGLFLLIAPQQIKPSDPPQIAIPTVWGSPLRAVIRPRWVFTFKYFPILEDLVFVDTTLQEDEIVVSDVRCRAEEPVRSEDAEEDTQLPPQSGGAVTVKVGLSYVVSTDPPDRAYHFVQAGRQKGVKDNLNNIVEGSTREEGSKHTWEYLTFGKARLSAHLIALVTGVQPTQKVRRSPSGEPLRDTTKSYRAYLLEPIEPDDVLEEIDYQAFLQDVLHNGYNDVHGLGIRIRRLNVMDVTPEGELKVDAERVAREQQQRRAEQMDIETNIQVARTIMRAANEGKTPDHPDYMSWETALKEARIQRGRADQVYLEGSTGGKAAIVNPRDKKRDTGGTKA